MNEAETRRRELLRQTRKLYHDDNFIPAVHPRYAGICRGLYNEESSKEDTGAGSFYIRLVVGILCFLCFVFMDQRNASVAEVNSNTVKEQIEKDFDTQMVINVWKSL